MIVDIVTWDDCERMRLGWLTQEADQSREQSGESPFRVAPLLAVQRVPLFDNIEHDDILNGRPVIRALRAAPKDAPERPQVAFWRASTSSRYFGAP